MDVVKISKYLARIILLAVIYHLAARLGLQMAYVQANTSPVWPPSGIGLAALLIFGIRYWPGIALGVIGGSLITGAYWPMALGMGLANTLEALIGAYLLNHVIRFHTALDRVSDVVWLAIAAAISTSVSASIGVATLYSTGRVAQNVLMMVWGTWWVGNLLGVLVITPFLLIWIKQFPRSVPRKWLIEGGVFLSLLFLVTGYVFNTQGDGILHQALIYLIFPFAIWAALRMERRGAVTAIVIISGITIWDTVHGQGPFSQFPINDSLIMLQTFTGVVSLTSLILAAAATERRHAHDDLNQRVEYLAALNDASKEFLGRPEQTSLLPAVCQFIIERMRLAAAWIELTTPEGTTAESGSPIVASYQMPQARFNPLKLRQQPAVHKMIVKSEDSGASAVLERLRDEAHNSGDTDLTFAVFPLGYSGKVAGVLCVIAFGSNELPKDEILLLESYANLAAVAIQNAWLFDQVRLGNEQLHALSQHLMEVQEAERMHLSRELHDESGQILAALMVRLGLLERDIEMPENRQAHIAELRRIVTEILTNLHNLAVKLRPASLDHLGLVTALKQYLDEYSDQYQMEVQFDALEIDANRLDPDVATALFRIVQESLTNVALHAKAGRVDILMNQRNGCLVMTIEDNGIGFNPNIIANESRLGLFGMRERVEMMNGALIIESAPGKGTTISVEVPFDDSGARR